MKLSIGTVLLGLVFGTLLGPLNVLAAGVPDAAVLDPNWWSHMGAVGLTSLGSAGVATIGIVSGALGLTLWQSRKEPPA
jgi:hypothetical protein